jgi:hypothetical protein
VERPQCADDVLLVGELERGGDVECPIGDVEGCLDELQSDRYASSAEDCVLRCPKATVVSRGFRMRGRTKAGGDCCSCQR